MRGRVMRRGRKVAVLAVAGTLMAGIGCAQIAAAAPAATTALTNSRPSFAAHAKSLGSVPASRPVDFEVLLALPDEAAVEAEVQALSTPGTSAFRHFLTPQEFRTDYSPSPAAVAAVEAWVRAAGLSVKAVAPSRLYVEVTGTMGRAERLVGTSFDTYAYQGHELAEPVSDYVIPASLESTVAGVANLDDSSVLQRPAAALPGPPKGVHYGIQPCSSYYGQDVATDKPPAYGQTWPYTICGYDADQYEQAFGLYDGIQQGTDGAGVTVAITDAYAAPTILSDADTWSTQNDLPTFAPGQFTQITPPADGYNDEGRCSPRGWYGEETLDVESVHAMAPGANIVYAGGKNCAGGLDTAWSNIIDNHLASVITDSWDSDTENLSQGEIDFYHEYLLEAATTGITVMFSSGDDGDEVTTTGTKQVGLPSSDPYATAVGGTSTEIGADGNIVFQAGWSNSYSELSKGAWTPAPPGTYSSGAGGGTSVLFDQPFYQVGVVPAKISKYNGKTPMRAVPDVAMPADPNTGLEIGETQTFPDGTYYATYRLGGTSLSSPLFAGVVADAIQTNAGSPIGFINPLLYEDIDTSAITDVTKPSSPQATVRTNLTNPTNVNSKLQFLLQTIDVSTTIYAGPGYDDQTGVGTPNGTYFLQAMKY